MAGLLPLLEPPTQLAFMLTKEFVKAEPVGEYETPIAPVLPPLEDPPVTGPVLTVN